MKSKLLMALLMGLFSDSLIGQSKNQYFDGADTFLSNSILIEFQNDSLNIWQIGKPQKAIFNSAATFPNALLTDTINPYPPNNSSSFQFTIAPQFFDRGIFALQWKQKLDMDSSLDGGKIEFSVDSGQTWMNAFNNPYVYNYYGFQTENADTLPNGDFVFSGTDSTWRDIWLCYDLSWLKWNDSIKVRFTFLSDSIDNNKDGWMIDNLWARITIIHTVNEIKQEKYLHVYPNPSSDILHIEIQKVREYHIIEHMTLINSEGKIVEEWKNIPTKFFITTKKYSNGLYYLKVQTNLRTETVPVIINHN